MRVSARLAEDVVNESEGGDTKKKSGHHHGTLFRYHLEGFALYANEKTQQNENSDESSSDTDADFFAPPGKTIAAEFVLYLRVEDACVG